MLSVLGLKNKNIGNKKPPSSVCFDKFFYGAKTGEEDKISQQIEGVLGDIENNVPKILDEFCKKIKNDEHIEDKLKYEISFFASMMWIRSKYLREQINRMSEEMLKWMFKFDAENKEHFYNSIKQTKDKDKKITNKDIEDVRQIILKDKYSVKFSNKTHLLMLSKMENFANMFFGKYWNVYVATGDYKFITSDTPVCEIFPERKTFYGHIFLSRKHYFPISQDILIEALYPNSNKKLRRKRVDDLSVVKLNLMIPLGSLDYCYASDNKFLEFILAVEKMARNKQNNNIDYSSTSS